MTSAGALEAMLVRYGAAKTVSAGFWNSVRPLPIVRSEYALKDASAGLSAIIALPETCAARAPDQATCDKALSAYALKGAEADAWMLHARVRRRQFRPPLFNRRSKRLESP